MSREFVQAPDGVQLTNHHVQQIIAALMGLEGDGSDAQLWGVPIRATAVKDDVLYALATRNRGAGGLHQKITSSDGTTTLFEVTDDGVFASIAGAAATQPFVMPGMIVAWHGLVTDIPDGWALCDGANGTPDLRDRFIIGAGSTYALNATGGSATANLQHTHLQDPHDHDHDHSYSIDHNHPSVNSDASTNSTVTVDTNEDGTTAEVRTPSHVHAVDLPDFDTADRTTNPDATATTATNQNAGSTTQSVLNPYWGLFYIKRIAA